MPGTPQRFAGPRTCAGSKCECYYETYPKMIILHNRHVIDGKHYKKSRCCEHGVKNVTDKRGPSTRQFQSPSKVSPFPCTFRAMLSLNSDPHDKMWKTLYPQLNSTQLNVENIVIDFNERMMFDFTTNTCSRIIPHNAINARAAWLRFYVLVVWCRHLFIIICDKTMCDKASFSSYAIRCKYIYCNLTR